MHQSAEQELIWAELPGRDKELVKVTPIHGVQYLNLAPGNRVMIYRDHEYPVRMRITMVVHAPADLTGAYKVYHVVPA